MPIVVAICNEKGGVSKTTTAMNVSSALARLGYSTLLIDMDPQADASIGFGVDYDQLPPETRTMSDVLSQKGCALVKALLHNL